MGQPARVAASGPYVYLTGNTQKEGDELFTIDEATTTASSSDEATTAPTLYEDQGIVTSYPNPFMNTVLLRVNGAGHESFNLRVVNTAGQIVETTEQLACDKDHYIGNAWPKGIYILKVSKGRELTTTRVVKTPE
jgi:hypothetical protein